MVKVKEPQAAECALLRQDQVLFTYLHLAADAAQAKAIMKSGATAIAYETVTSPNGSLPLLTPMSEVAGRMSIQVGAASLQKANGGFGVLLGGVPGVPPAKVVILGGGVSGTHAAEMAVGMRADVTVVDRSVPRLRELSTIFGSALRTSYSTTETIERLVRDADLVVGAVLVTGAAAPKLVTRAMIKTHEARRGARGHLHRPGRVLRDQPPHDARGPHLRGRRRHPLLRRQHARRRSRTSTFALTNATLPYVRALADLGWRAAFKRDAGLAAGLNVHGGEITHEAVARALGLTARPYSG